MRANPPLSPTNHPMDSDADTMHARAAAERVRAATRKRMASKRAEAKQILKDDRKCHKSWKKDEDVNDMDPSAHKPTMGIWMMIILYK